MRRNFDETGPPVYAAAAAYLGIKLKDPPKPKSSLLAPAPGIVTFDTPEEMAAEFARLKASGAF